MTPKFGVSVAIDIGNTAAKWSSRCGDATPPTAVQRVALRADDWPEQIIHAVGLLACGSAVRWRIAAVNTPARDRLVQSLNEPVFSPHGVPAEVSVIARSDVPIVTRLSHPDRVGIDRLLAVWKATRTYPGQRVVVVDAGSAITIDCASPEGEFRGGVIMPGLSLQFDSLARGTDALPAIHPSETAERSAADFPVPASDTVAAIRSGIMLGTAAAIDALVNYTQAGQWHQLILTGGDADRLSPLINHPHAVLERLVIDAILDQA